MIKSFIVGAFKSIGLVGWLILSATVNIAIFIVGKWIIDSRGGTDYTVLFWICIALAMIFSFVVFVIHSVGEEKESKCDINEEYRKIDAEKVPGERFKKIDDLYKVKTSVVNLFENADIFKRKAFLLTRLKDEEKKKSFWESLITIDLTTLVTAFVSGNLLGVEFDKLDAVPLFIVLIILVSFIFMNRFLLLDAVLNEKEDVWNQIRKYELSYIEKALDDRIESRSLNEKLLLVKTEDKTYLLTLK